MMTETSSAVYTLETMVGRQQIEDEACRLIEQASAVPQVVSITGEGGIGKTRLVYAVRERLSSNDRYCITRRGYEIDCYDLEPHSKLRMAQRLVESLPPELAPFEQYRAAQRELHDSELAGAVKEAAAQRDKTLKTFLSELRQLSERYHVVFFIDTTERLVYYKDPQGKTEDLIANSWLWLVDEIPQLPNVTWIMAGRPESDLLFTSLPNNIVQRLQVNPLDRSGCEAFFRTIAAAAARNSDKKSVAVLSSLNADFIDRAYSLTGGVPLRLSLLAYLATSRNLGAVDRIFQKTGDATDFDREVINHLLAGPEFGLVLRTVGRLRKGFDEKILYAVLREEELSRSDIAEYVASLKLFAFVKQPRSGRLFFHDVMYELLDKYASDGASRREANRIYPRILSIYSQKEKELTTELKKLFVPVERERRPAALNREKLNVLLQERRQTLLDRLYYELSKDANRGFRFYFRYSFEAISSGDPALDVLVTAELLNFLKEQEAQNKLTNDKLDRSIVYGVSLPRKIARACAEGRFDQANDEAEVAWRRFEQDPATFGGELTRAMLAAWQGLALTELGRMYDEKAEQLLQSAADLLSKKLNSDALPGSAAAFRAQGGLAFAAEKLGYYYRTRGKLNKAITYYELAVRHGREVKVWINLASALTSLGLVHAQLNNLEDAQALIEEGAEKRTELGLPNLIAGSTNTLGLVSRRRGAYETAIDQHERALVVFRAIGNRDGVRMAMINLVEALRRNSVRKIHPLAQQIELAERARKIAWEAVDLSDDSDIQRQQLRVRELLELGCATRDLVRLYLEDRHLHADVDALVAESARALTRAAELAGDSLWVRQLDALTNLAFLRAYADQPQQAFEALALAEQTVPEAYTFHVGSPRPPINSETASTDVWLHLAKQNTLRGHLIADQLKALKHDAANAHKEADKQSVQDYLTTMARYYLFSIEYNSLHNSDSIGIVQSSQQIFDTISQLETDELKWFAQKVYGIEQQYNMTEGSELRRILKRRVLWYGD